MFLSTLNSLTFLSSRNGTRKDGGSWYSLAAYDDRGTSYVLFLNQSAKESAVDLLSSLCTGDKINLLLECTPSFDGKSYRVTVQDIQLNS